MSILKLPSDFRGSLWNGRSLVFALILLLLFSAGRERLEAQAEPSTEYALKAVFLFNFTQFVDWPTDAFTTDTESIVIVILGDDPFNGYLDETVREEKVGGRSLSIRRCRSLDEIGVCHMLFISASESSSIAAIIDRLHDRSVLTVADTENASREGVMIRFVTEKKKIKLRINVEASKRSNLSISSKLLRLAEIVEPGKD